jgi:hypothetical protein
LLIIELGEEQNIFSCLHPSLFFTNIAFWSGFDWNNLFQDGVEGSVGGSGIQSPVESGDEGPTKLPKAAIAFFKRTRKHDSAASSVIGGATDSNLLHVVDKNSQVSFIKDEGQFY